MILNENKGTATGRENRDGLPVCGLQEGCVGGDGHLIHGTAF